MNLITGDKIFIGCMVTALVIVILSFIFIDVDAVTRSDIKELEQKINEAEKNIESFDLKIQEQNKKINDRELEMNEAKEKLRQVKRDSNDSWTATLEIDGAERNLKAATDLYTKERTNLGKFITERSNNIKILKQLTKQLTNDEISFKRDSIIDLSELHKLIGIELSNSCISLLKSNSTTTCPDYELLTTALDSSIIEVSGDFITIDGFYQRENPTLKNSWRFYDYDDRIRIIVDPPQGMNDKIRMIEISPNFDTYLLRHNLTQQIKYENITTEFFDTYRNKTITSVEKQKVQDQSFIIYHDRYVDKCRHAIINADKWQKLIADTIHYLRTDCTITKFIDYEIIKPNYTDIDITTSRQYQYDLWLKNVTENCLFKYGVC